jgi:hypothetical protein
VHHARGHEGLGHARALLMYAQQIEQAGAVVDGIDEL